ncbi:hypothetical protein XENORESO_013445, partial [Xenotaenia resolanae]
LEGSVALPKESFSSVLTKNIMAMMVWLVLSIINSSMVHTFLQHSSFPLTLVFSTRTPATSCSSAWWSMMLCSSRL